MNWRGVANISNSGTLATDTLLGTVVVVVATAVATDDVAANDTTRALSLSLAAPAANTMSFETGFAIIRCASTILVTLCASIVVNAPLM